MKATRSINWGGVSALLTTVFWWLFGQVLPTVVVPIEVAAAITGLIGYAVAFFVPDSDTEVREMKREVDAKPSPPTST